MPLPSSYGAKFKFHLPLWQFISRREDQRANYVLRFRDFDVYISTQILCSSCMSVRFFFFSTWVFSREQKKRTIPLPRQLAAALFIPDQSDARGEFLVQADRKLGSRKSERNEIFGRFDTAG